MGAEGRSLRREAASSVHGDIAPPAADCMILSLMEGMSRRRCEAMEDDVMMKGVCVC